MFGAACTTNGIRKSIDFHGNIVGPCDLNDMHSNEQIVDLDGLGLGIQDIIKSFSAHSDWQAFRICSVPPIPHLEPIVHYNTKTTQLRSNDA